MVILLVLSPLAMLPRPTFSLVSPPTMVRDLLKAFLTDGVLPLRLVRVPRAPLGTAPMTRPVISLLMHP